MSEMIFKPLGMKNTYVFDDDKDRKKIVPSYKGNGVEIGFHAHDALKMAVQTAKGAADLLLLNQTHPETEIDKVTSPKGCTIAGLNEMELHGFSSSLIKGIKTSLKQIKG